MAVSLDDGATWLLPRWLGAPVAPPLAELQLAAASLRGAVGVDPHVAALAQLTAMLPSPPEG